MNIVNITDFEDKALDVYARMTENELAHYPDNTPGMFVAESPKVIERALNAGYEPVSFLVEDRHIDTQAKELIEANPLVTVYTAPFDVLTGLTGYKLTRGMLCAMKRKTLLRVESVLKSAKRVVILEEVMNPTNVGAIFRSAAALGMDGVIMTGGCSDALYRRAARVSMGCVFQIPWTRFEDRLDWPGEGIGLLQEYGFRTIAFALRKESVDINDEILKSQDKLAIILGTEGEGLIDQTLDMCDYTVKIPMHHGVDSLNVATAGAIAFWELGKKY